MLERPEAFPAPPHDTLTHFLLSSEDSTRQQGVEPVSRLVAPNTDKADA